MGEVEGGTFIKRVRASAHFLRRPPSIAFDLASLADAERAGAARVEIHDTESGRTYTAPISTIRARGFQFDRGHGEQVALPLKHWGADRGGDSTGPGPNLPPEADELAEQLPLLAEVWA